MKKIYIGAAVWGGAHHTRDEIAAAFGTEYAETLKTDDSLLGASLLLDMLHYTHRRPGRSAHIKRGGNGKPYFCHWRHIDFSISHSSGVAVCAITADGARVGADIEIYGTGGRYCGDTAAERRRRLAERWLIPHGFAPSDHTRDGNQSDIAAFTRAWTAFEAASKYRGGNLGESNDIPRGTVISHFDIKAPNRAGAVAVCSDEDATVIPCPEFYAVTRGVPRVTVLGVEFNPLTRSAAAKRAADHLMHGTGLFTVVTPNPVISMNCRRDPKLMADVNTASLSVADGRGVIDAARRQGTPLPERVCGIDLAEDILTVAAACGRRVFLLGGAPGRAEQAAALLKEKHAGLKICGTLDGYGGIADTARATEILKAAAPDILFVCLGSPRQEMMIFENAAMLSAAGVKLAAALGGSIDVWSGNVRRAPNFMIKARLEWLWRCAIEPRRLRVIPTLVKYRMLTK